MSESEELIGSGCKVMLHFSLTLTDGTVAESSFDDEPMEFIVGDGTMIEGLELVLYGLKAGDKKQVTIDPAAAFGDSSDENIHMLPRDDFSSDMELEPNLIIAFSTPAGDDVPGTILEVNENEVKVDFNHPLAGHQLVFEFEILDVKPSSDPVH